MVDIPDTLNHEVIRKELLFDNDDRWAIPALTRKTVVDSAIIQRKIIIKDDTFRESTNMPGTSPSNKQKLKLAKLFVKSGIKEIVAGHAGIREQCDFMKMIKESDLNLMVHAYVDFGDWKRGIQNAIDVGADAIWMPGALNPSPIFAGKLGAEYGYWSNKFDLIKVMDSVKAAVQFAKDNDKFITVGRSPMIASIFEKTIETYVKTGADRICIFDDRGNYTPHTMSYIVKMHRDAAGPDIGLEVHCHDDFGLALANSLEAVRSGADVIDCVLNGYSHRSGNCALEQIVAALEVLYNVKTGVDLKKLVSLCKFASEIFGVPIPSQAPHIGSSAYAYGGVHISALLREGWFVWETIKAETLGQKRNITWTPTAIERHGIAGPVALKIQSMGFQIDEAKLNQVFDEMRKEMSKKKVLTDEELEKIVNDVLNR